jgi:hypothetical protein
VVGIARLCAGFAAQEYTWSTATTKAVCPIVLPAKDKLRLRREMATGTISASCKIRDNRRSPAGAFHRDYSGSAVSLHIWPKTDISNGAEIQDPITTSFALLLVDL